MASLADILNWWDENVVPIVAQRMATFSSFRHKDDAIQMSEIEGLEDAINSKSSAVDISAALATKVSKWENWQGDLIVEGGVVTNGITNPDSFWEISGAGDATFRNATINTLSNVMLKVNADGKLVAAVAGTDYQTPIGYSPVNKAGDTMLGHLTLVGDAVNALHPITKSQFDNLQTGLSWKYSARASTVAALPSYTVSGDFLTLTATANGALALDGVTLVVGDRILVKNEAGAARVNNGAYTVTQVGSVSQPFILTRTTAANTSEGLTAATFYVREGAIEANRIYAVNTNPVALGTTQITFALVAGAGTYANGTGLDLTGNVFSIANAGVSNAMLAGGISDAKISSAANWNTAFNSRISSLTNTGSSGAATFVGNVLNIPTYTLAGLGGVSASVANTWSANQTFGSSARILIADGSSAAPSIAFTSNPTYGIYWNSGLTALHISAGAGGSGMVFRNNSNTSYTSLNPASDNALDLGAFNSSQWRQGFFASSLLVGGLKGSGFNRLMVCPLQYSVGTIAQSGNTVTGTGTNFTSAMIGSVLSNLNGAVSIITAVNSPTSLSVNASQTIASGSTYSIHYYGLQVDSLGAISIGNTVNTVSPTSPNRTITMVINGTTYYIPCKTTND